MSSLEPEERTHELAPVVEYAATAPRTSETAPAPHAIAPEPSAELAPAEADLGLVEPLDTPNDSPPPFTLEATATEVLEPIAVPLPTPAEMPPVEPPAAEFAVAQSTPDAVLAEPEPHTPPPPAAIDLQIAAPVEATAPPFPEPPPTLVPTTVEDAAAPVAEPEPNVAEARALEPPSPPADTIRPPPLAPLAAPVIAAAAIAPPAPPIWTLPPAEVLPPPPAPVARPIRATWQIWLRRAALASFALAVGYAALILVLIVAYRYVDPPRSTVMLGLHLTGRSVDYEPVPITSISSYLQRAVITSEDARFCSHNGVDWGALAEAIQDSRGGSTITMQTAKNLFLWPSRSYIRKAIEIPVALTIDFAWPKRRILEVYLNIAEWGPGVFGAEAAAQYHFGKPASRLTAHEATLLAAALPNPIAREAGDPGRVTALLATRLRARMAHSDSYVGCLGLRRLQRADPEPQQKPATVPKPSPWQTKTQPAKPERPFNPWQN